MRRVRLMMLVLLTLALPTAALASGISFNTGTFSSGTFTPNFGSPFRLDLSGTGGNASRIVIQNVTLTCSGSTCSLSGGGLFVFGPTGVGVFNSSITGGTVTIGSTGATVTGTFAPKVPGAPDGGNFSFGVTFTSLASGHLTGGRGFVNAPEPGALEGLLLGIGVLGLVETRRKLKLGT